MMRQHCCQAMRRCALAAFGTEAGRKDQSFYLPEKQTSRCRDNGDHDLSEHNSSSAQLNRQRSTASCTLHAHVLIMKYNICTHHSKRSLSLVLRGPRGPRYSDCTACHRVRVLALGIYTVNDCF